MKRILSQLFMVLIIGVLFISCNQSSQFESNLTNLKGPYLGQTPPGNIPELFAPGYVADMYREHGSAAFTPDGKELFWTRQVRIIHEDERMSRLVVGMHMKQLNGVWTKPALAPFSSDRWTFITGITSDGRRLYFASSKPIEGNDEFTSRAWVVDKNENSWGEPKQFKALDKFGMSFSKVQETNSGNIYFTSKLPKQGLQYESWGVGFYRSRLVDGEYQKPDTLSININSEYLDYGWHIDNDEKFIIFSSARPGGYSSLDMYISYRQIDDSWSEAINLGEKINTYGADGSDWPFLSPDGKYLFFMTKMQASKKVDHLNYSLDELLESQLSITNGNSKIHWVSTGFVEKLKPIK